MQGIFSFHNPLSSPSLYGLNYQICSSCVNIWASGSVYSIRKPALRLNPSRKTQGNSKKSGSLLKFVMMIKSSWLPASYHLCSFDQTFSGLPRPLSQAPESSLGPQTEQVPKCPHASFSACPKNELTRRDTLPFNPQRSCLLACPTSLKISVRAFLMVQWLRIHLSRQGSIPGSGEIPYAVPRLLSPRAIATKACTP